MKLDPATSPDTATSADLRETALYREAEAIFRQALQPGCGRPTSAIELTAAPDGKRIAFTGSLFEKLEGVPATRICTADLDRGDVRVVSFGPNTDLTPKFSPDGATLAFRSDRSGPGNFQLYFIDLASGLTRAAASAPGWIEYFEFSPDGTRILAGLAGHGADVSGAQGAKTSKTLDSSAAAWMPTIETGDERHKRRGAWMLDLARDAWTRATPESLNVWEACWCGSQALAAVVSSGGAEEDWYRAHLVHVSLPSKKLRVLYRPKDQLEWLAGSPDGRTLAFVEAVCSDRWVVAGDLRLVDLKSGRVRELASNGIDVTSTAWRNSRRLLVGGIRDFETVVADIDAASGAVHERWANAELYSQNFFYPAPVPVPGTADGAVFNAHGHLQPSSVLHVTTSGARKVLDFAHEGSRALVRKLRPVEPYPWRAPDGTEIRGWLMRGSGRKPAPLIMEVHGGPIWRWPPMFLGRSAQHVMLAERGYALFWPNPRGSSGRGQDYARAVVGDMGGADTQDYLSGLDQLVADGIADGRRIGITGGSYGGFMSAWLITQDSRFAAAVPVAPVTHWVSQHLTSNIPYFDTFCLGSEYHDAHGNHFTRSPVMHAHRVKTPTLNICGALDRCTPPGQAMEFHNALRQHGVESVLVTYPHEGHGVRTFPGMIDYAARVVDWFVRHMPPKR